MAADTIRRGRRRRRSSLKRRVGTGRRNGTKSWGQSTEKLPGRAGEVVAARPLDELDRNEIEPWILASRRQARYSPADGWMPKHHSPVREPHSGSGNSSVSCTTDFPSFALADREADIRSVAWGPLRSASSLLPQSVLPDVREWTTGAKHAPFRRFADACDNGDAVALTLRNPTSDGPVKRLEEFFCHADGCRS